jgi:hypothetical protein
MLTRDTRNTNLIVFDLYSYCKKCIIITKQHKIIIQSYYIFYIDGDFKNIFKIKPTPIKKGGGGGINTKYKKPVYPPTTLLWGV